MSEEDLVALLQLIGLAQGRQFDGLDAEMWHDALTGISFADAIAAVRAHVRDSSDFLDPARLRARVRRAYADRVAAAGTPPLPPVDPDDRDAWRGWLRAWRAAVVAGEPPERAADLADQAARRAGTYRPELGRRAGSGRPAPAEGRRAPVLVRGEVVPDDEVWPCDDRARDWGTR